MQTFDQKVPKALKKTQQWFGSIIEVPLAEDGGIQKKTPLGNSIEEEAPQFIAPSPTLKPYQRIQIYNQQYWWRLLEILQENFPLVVRLFGYADFNHTLGIPYLLKHRPNHWSLNNLGDQLPNWLLDEYKAPDKEMIYHASILDLAFHNLFFKKLLPPITEVTEDLLYLQPHVAMFLFPYNLTKFRKELLKQEPDYWLENDFPILDKTPHYTYLYRTRQNTMTWKTSSEAEFALLHQFQKGISIDNLCDWLENQPDSIRLEAETNLQLWFKQWTEREILTLCAS